MVEFGGLPATGIGDWQAHEAAPTSSRPTLAALAAGNRVMIPIRIG
jgi:hypothetical protein